MALTAEKQTSIRLNRDTWRRLNLLRRDPQQSMDRVISALLDEHERREAAEERRAG